MRSTQVKKLTLTAVFIAISVIGSLFSFPILGSKCAPVQHLMNILGAVFLGPGYALLAAFVTSLIRNMLGLGTLLAFPGSMCGALLSGILYKYLKKLPFAYFGEVIGTGIIGGTLAYPLAALVMGKEVAVFAFVVPFLISTCGGTMIAIVLVTSLQKMGILGRWLGELKPERS